MAIVERFSWDLGNGVTSEADSPITTYVPGAYTVAMTVYYDNGSTDVVTKELYINVADGNNSNLSEDYIKFPKSFHYGWADEHGYGWSENAGDAFVWPESQASVLLYEENGFTEKVVWDIYTRQPYVINTRDTYHSDAIYEDRADVDGENGIPIESTIIFPEFSGDRKHLDITHTETNIRFRPELNEEALDPTLEIDIALLVGDREEQVAIKRNIDFEKEVTFYYQNNKKGNVITNQLKVVTSESKFQMMGIEAYFRTNDRFKSPAKYVPSEASLILSDPLVWITRWNYEIDRVSKSELPVSDVVLLEGPDYKADSGADVTTLQYIIPEGVEAQSFWSTNLSRTETKVGTPINGWQLYYLNAPVSSGLVQSFNGATIYDLRYYSQTVADSTFTDYYDNLERYVPR